jgi:rhodanese-related sulfurtransferase
MKLFRPFLLLAVAAVAAIPLFCCAAEHAKDPLETVKKNVSQKKAVLVDVREEGEWESGHIDGAQSLPLSELEDADAKTLSKRLPKNKIIYIHCLSGGRALAAAEILQPQGFDIRPLKPGYHALLKAGFKRAEK